MWKTITGRLRASLQKLSRRTMSWFDEPDEYGTSRGVVAFREPGAFVEGDDVLRIHVHVAGSRPRVPEGEPVLSETVVSRLSEVVGYVGGRGLPVGRWTFWGLEEVPLSARTSAAWLARLAERSGGAVVEIVLEPRLQGLRRRLAAYLTRRGCRIIAESEETT